MYAIRSYYDQRRAVVPVQALAALNHHVAVEGGQGNEAHILDADLGGEGEVVGLDGLVGGLIVVHQVHLVDGDQQVRDADQMGQRRMPAGLGEHALARVHQDDRQVGGGGRRLV